MSTHRDARTSRLGWMLALVGAVWPLQSLADRATVAIPGQVPVETLWTEFEAGGDLESLGGLPELIDRFSQDSDDAAAEARCLDEGPELARMLAAYPVSLRLWSLELGCAAHAGDVTREDIARGALRALFEHDLERGRWPKTGYKPIRVLTEFDAATWIELSGLDTIALYYPFHANGVLLLRAELWSEEDQAESYWSFDYVSGMAKRIGTGDAALVASARLGLIHELRTGGREAPDSLLGEYSQAVDALQKKDTDGLLRLAGADNAMAQRMLADLCLVMRAADCAEAAIDALLPLAESGSAINLLYLSYAHAFGLGVTPDPDAAAELFRRARARIGPNAANYSYLDMLANGRRSARSQAFLVESVRSHARTGDVMARFLWLRLQSSEGRKLSRRERADLLELSRAQDPAALLLAATIALDEEPELGRAELQRAADAGDLGAARLLLVVNERLGAPSLAEQMKLYEGILQHEIRPLILADYLELLRSRGESRRANQWLQVQAQLGVPEALMDLALAMIAGADGIDSNPQQARRILEIMIRDSKDDAWRVRARRELAKLLLDGADGVEADLPAALALFRANTLDPESILYLAVLLVRHPEQAQPGENGEALLRARAESDDTAAQYELALLILAGKLSADDPASSLAWMERAQSGSEDALNLYCWTLCTHRNPQLRDPARALTVLDDLKKLADGEPAYLDTVAACLAANDRFDEAITTQQAALDALAPSASDAARQSLNERLTLYRTQQPYLEPK